MMKRLLLCLFLTPAIAFGAAYDLFVDQRNPTNNATVTKTLTIPGLGVNGLMGYQGMSNIPFIWRLGNSFMFNGNTIESASDWMNVTSKPVFATVSTTGNYNDLINKPVLAPVAVSGDYADLTGKPTIPSAQVNSDWNALSGPAQITNKPTTLAGYGITDAYPLSGNPSGFLIGITSGQVTGALGFTPYNATNPSGFVSQAGARSALSLTTTGTAGAATYNPSTGVLNVPNYAPGTGTVTSVTAGTGLSGGTITTSGTISMPNVGTSGAYSGVTTDAQGRVTAGTNRSQSPVTRALNTVFQVSATRDANVQYAVQCTVTASIGGGQDGDVFLDIASDSGFTANVQSVDVAPCSQTYTLAIAIQGVQKGPANVRGYVPAGYYARIRTVNNTGTPAFAYRLGQEVLQ